MDNTKRDTSVIDLYELIADDIPVGLWRADKDGKLTFINEKLRKYFSDTHLGTHFTNLICNPSDKFRIMSEFSHSGKSSFEFSDNGGSEKWYKMTIYSEGDNYIGIIKNITSQKVLLPMLMSMKNERLFTDN